MWIGFDKVCGWILNFGVLARFFDQDMMLAVPKLEREFSAYWKLIKHPVNDIEFHLDEFSGVTRVFFTRVQTRNLSHPPPPWVKLGVFSKKIALLYMEFFELFRRRLGPKPWSPSSCYTTEWIIIN